MGTGGSHDPNVLDVDTGLEYPPDKGLAYEWCRLIQIDPTWWYLIAVVKAGNHKRFLRVAKGYILPEHKAHESPIRQVARVDLRLIEWPDMRDTIDEGMLKLHELSSKEEVHYASTPTR